MFISKDICPVPFDQQPLNEYVSLKKSCFFSWSVLPTSEYLNTIYTIFSVLFIVFIPLVLAIMPNNRHLISLFLLDVSIVTFLLIIIFIRLYLGWSYIIKRLVSATVFYEESGWYDGQVWIKTAEIMTKDRLVGLYEVSPYMYRIKCTLFTVIILFTLETMLLYLI